MSEELGDPDATLVFMFNTTRCGSTLLTQMLEETKECVSISEPTVDFYVSASFQKNGDTPAVRQITRDAYRWVCRPYSYIKPKLYFVKVLAPCSLGAPVIKEAFPHSKFLFMYRDPVYVAKSVHKVSSQFPLLLLMFAVGRYSANFVESAFNSMGYAGKDLKIKFVDHYTLGIQLVCLVSKLYLDLLDQGKIGIAAVRYEDLVSDASFAMGQIIRFMELPESWVELSLEGLKKDSQRNSILAQSALSGYVDVPMSAESRELANKLLQQSGLPLVGDKSPLRGTITCKA